MNRLSVPACISLCASMCQSVPVDTDILVSAYFFRNSITSVVVYVPFYVCFILGHLYNDVVSFQDSDPPHCGQSCSTDQCGCSTWDLVLTQSSVMPLFKLHHVSSHVCVCVGGCEREKECVRVTVCVCLFECV